MNVAVSESSHHEVIADEEQQQQEQSNDKAEPILEIDTMDVGEEEVEDYLQTGAFEKGSTSQKSQPISEEKKCETTEMGQGIL